MKPTRRIAVLLLALAMVLHMLPGNVVMASDRCVDDDEDHCCDHCGEWLSDCEDNDGDGYCDYSGCEEYIGECFDDDEDHCCDDCGEWLSDCEDKNKDYICDICGEIYWDGYVYAVHLNTNYLELENGTTMQLKATVENEEAYNKNIVWTSSNPNVATVDGNGIVTAVSNGYAEITATATDGSEEYDVCEVYAFTVHHVTDWKDLQSDHDYADNCRDWWICTIPCATVFTIRFDVISLEDNYDYLYIYDSKNQLVATLNGMELRDQSVVITGDTVKMQLATDDSVIEWGFRVLDVEVHAYNHSYVATVTPPTCTTQGYTTHVCSVCGDTYVDSYVAPTGHKYGDWFITQTPDCTNTGLEQRNCINSGCTHFETRIVDALGHDYHGVVTEPTCTAQGYTTYTCSRCGDHYVSDYTPMAPHTYVTSVTAPTCTEQGYTTYTCSGCGNSYVADYVPALGHKAVVDQAVAPTCTETGLTEGTHCGRCNKTLVEQRIVPATGHSYGDWFVTKNPTCTETGLERRECQNAGCEHFETRVVAELGHSFGEYVSNGDATCTEDGTKSAKCERCIAVHTVADPGSALGHDYQSVVVAPSCTSEGYTIHTCSLCSSSYVDSYVPSAPHSYVYQVSLAPTRDTPGYLYGQCEICGAETTMGLPVLNEVDYTYTVIQEPTANETGVGRYTWKNTEYGTFWFDVILDKTAAHTPGDINGDGKVNNRDAARLMQYLAGWEVEVITDALDVNGDGKVNNRDAARLMQYLAGWEVEIF